MTLGNDNGTDGQIDGQTECDAMRAPSREEGRIITHYKVACVRRSGKRLVVHIVKNSSLRIRAKLDGNL